MGRALFRTKLKRPGAVGPASPAAPSKAEEAPAACPPCTGRCFQGRACPASPTANPTLVALLRRSPQQ